MGDNYSIYVKLNLFELDRILSVIEEKENLKEEGEVIRNKIYNKLENALLSIKLEKNDSVETILKEQRKYYIKK